MNIVNDILETNKKIFKKNTSKPYIKKYIKIIIKLHNIKKITKDKNTKP